MNNAQVARILSEIADVMELLGENQFKVRAYRQASQVIDLLPGPVGELSRRRELTNLPGIGERIATHIGELLETGRCQEHDELISQVPPGILELLRIEGVGPKTVAALWHSLGITSVEALERACLDGSVQQLARMGETRAQSILKAIQRHRGRQGRTPLYHALPFAEAIVLRLRALPFVSRAEIAGSVRRRRETIGDIDVLVSSRSPARVMRAFAEMPDVVHVMAGGATKSSVRLSGGIQADLRVVPINAFGAALHYFTGSKTHNIAIRSRAVRMGKKLSEYGIFDREGERLGGANEEEVFEAVGLPWIAPELREGAGEIEAADAGTLPTLIEEHELRGDLHVHSKASSDGRSTIEELAGEARRLGRSYLAITEHSRSRPLGLDADALLRHAAEIRVLDKKLRGRPHLLTGIEVDILPDGSLDLPLEVLAALDCVVASVHSHFNQSRETMTRRIVRALRSGVVHVLGHPSGRQIGSRDPYDMDLEEVLDVAREQGVAMEVNAMPDRLDLNDKGCRLAKAKGVTLAISSDAHHTSHLSNLRYGVWVARRGWIEAGDVLNTLPYSELIRRLRRKGQPTERAPSEAISP